MTTLTSAEQLILEMINRARMDPDGEAARLAALHTTQGGGVTYPGFTLNENLAAGTISSVPKEVLAGNNLLTNAARGHDAAMLSFVEPDGKHVLDYRPPGATQYNMHTQAGDYDPKTRIQQAGYVENWGNQFYRDENVGAQSIYTPGTYDTRDPIAKLEDDLFTDTYDPNRGHRLAIMADNVREVGIGVSTGNISYSSGTYNSDVATEDFGSASANSYFLTGAVYNDANKNNFYDIGEGVANVTATVTPTAGGAGGSDVTGTGGGWSVKETGGSFQVKFTGTGLDANGVIATVDSGSHNAKVDLVNGNEIFSNVNTTLGNGAKELHLLGIDSVNGAGNADANVIVGNAGANLLTGGGGNDTIDGKDGIDTAAFSGSLADYQVKSKVGATVVLEDIRNGSPDGTDTISNVENFKFSDKTVSFADLQVTTAPVVTKPDLVVDSVTAAGSVVQGQKLDISYIVKNLGNATAAAHSAGINVDNPVDATHSVGSNAVASLVANGQATYSNSIDTTNLAVGQHTLYIKEDSQDSVAESNETNNVHTVTFNVTAPVVTKPDLVVDTVTAATSVVQGQKLDISYIVKNLGNATAGAHSAGINVDNPVDATHSIASNAVGSLAANGQATYSNSIDTSNLTVGQHTLYIMEDSQGGVSESNESNNVHTVTFNVTAPVVSKPDLVVDSISAATSVVQGQKLDLSYVVKDLGNAAAGAHYAGINVDGAVDESHYVGWNKVDSVAGNGQATFSNSIDTSNLAVGQHTITISEDFWHNAVGESNETNNAKTFTFNVTAPVVSKPDLVVDSISAATSVVQGQKLDFSYVVKDQGNAAAGTHFAGFNVDGAVDESHYVGWNQVGSVAANGQATLSNSIDTSNLSVGQHTLYVAEDFWHNAVGESNETNNVHAFTFNVTAPKPDLVVDSISAPASVAQGDEFDIFYLVKNLGNTAAGLHYAGFNVDGAVDESHYVGWNKVDSVAANGQATLTNSIDTSHLSVGQHTLYVAEDFWHNAVGESNETNNVKAITFNVTAPKPDLVVDSISAATSVMQGGHLDFSFVVKNLGAAAAGLHYAGFNVDGAVDESHYMGWNTVNSVAGHGQASFTDSIDTSNLTVGQHTLYVKDDFWHNAVGESNETNNVHALTFNVTPFHA